MIRKSVLFAIVAALLASHAIAEPAGKGPQGTLFGRNTTGGAVLYTTARPNFDRFSAFAKARIGNLDMRYLEGAVNLPLGSDLAVRIAGSLHKRDGFVRNIVNGENLSDIDRHSARGTIAWRPTDRFETTLVGEINRAKGSSRGSQRLDSGRRSPTRPTGSNTPRFPISAGQASGTSSRRMAVQHLANS